MINLNAPINISIDLYDNIVNNKNSDRKYRLIHLRNLVNNRYQEYINNRNELSVLQQLNNLSEDEKKDLISCYGDNVEFKKAEKEIKELQSIAMQSVCPYCGIGEPNTLDHYIPKSLFPEFSVFGINLLPCCWACNKEKGEVWLENGSRRIINLYFDTIPNVKVLFTSIRYSDNSNIPTISLELRNSPSINPAFFQIIQTHYRDLKLIDRFEKKLNDEISNIYQTVVSSLSLSIEEQKRNLRYWSNTFRRKYGVNYWKASLYDAICECNEFFEKCYDTAC